jgi:hypothetical protein
MKSGEVIGHMEGKNGVLLLLLLLLLVAVRLRGQQPPQPLLLTLPNPKTWNGEDWSGEELRGVPDEVPDPDDDDDGTPLDDVAPPVKSDEDTDEDEEDVEEVPVVTEDVN